MCPVLLSHSDLLHSQNKTMSGPTIDQLVALAAKGVPEAKMLLSMRREAVQNQDDQDRRWRNLAYAIDVLKEQGKEPQTCQQYLDVFAKYGWFPFNRPTAAQRACKMRFDQLMTVCGGVDKVDDYPAKGEPDAPPKCEGCRQKVAALRCSWCGEYYCSQPCFVKDRKDHMAACRTAVENMHCGMPPTKVPALWSAQQYAKTYGLAQPGAAKAGRGCSSSRAATAGPAAQLAQEAEDSKLEASVAALDVGGGGRTKTQKRREAKKRQKEREQKAAAAQEAAAAGSSAAAGDEQNGKEEQPVVAE